MMGGSAPGSALGCPVLRRWAGGGEGDAALPRAALGLWGHGHGVVARLGWEGPYGSQNCGITARIGLKGPYGS